MISGNQLYTYLCYRSEQPGDGGLCPGKLVFTEEIEKFAAQP
jgi:hypothetical protein